MNVQLLKECLTNAQRIELGIPYVIDCLGESSVFFSITQWALEGKPEEGRQVWFAVGNAKDLRNQIPPFQRGRLLPLTPEQLDTHLKRGPFDALLLPKHGLAYADPTMTLSDFWVQRGSYQLCQQFQCETLQLWFWTPKLSVLKLFGMDHHHAVLWDARKVLRPLGIHLDFYWLSDGRPPVNEAIPVTLPSFESSLDIYRREPMKPLSKEFLDFLKKQSYQGILTSHSIVTSFRLRESALPMYHINSTRFGNDWIQQPSKHQILVESIKNLLQINRLTVIHNNLGDKHYFHQYFPEVAPQQEILIPSLCEQGMRLRSKTPQTPKLLLWDTRQVLLQEGKSPFMKQLYAKCKKAWGDAFESQAVLMAQTGSYLPEGYLDEFSAVIHIPYNVSTMSMFEQARANIPIWVPSQRLLKQLWVDAQEPNELSWTVFAPGTEANASTMDAVRNPEVVERWVNIADFYNPEILPSALTFDSIEELVEKGLTTEYQNIINTSEVSHQQRREAIYFAWEQVFQSLRQRPKGLTA